MDNTTEQKRAELNVFIQRVVVKEPSVQGIVVIGSVAKGTAREDSDIDAFVFLEPFDLYAVPAEFKWLPNENTFHSIFSHVPGSIQLDFHRLDLPQWAKPTYEWPEATCAELSAGWLAYDRQGAIKKLVAERTLYSAEFRQKRLDDAITGLDWLISEETTDRTWENLGPSVAHYRLHAAFDYLVQGLFAYNQRWRTWHSREMSVLMTLSWLPEGFKQQLLRMTNALSDTKAGYQQRVEALQTDLAALVERCQDDGLYGEDAVGEAFIRQHEEPGRSWNIEAWSKQHKERL